LQKLNAPATCCESIIRRKMFISRLVFLPVHRQPLGIVLYRSGLLVLLFGEILTRHLG
jgi:hypothetical protein